MARKRKKLSQLETELGQAPQGAPEADAPPADNAPGAVQLSAEQQARQSVAFDMFARAIARFPAQYLGLPPPLAKSEEDTLAPPIVTLLELYAPAWLVNAGPWVHLSMAVEAVYGPRLVALLEAKRQEAERAHHAPEAAHRGGVGLGQDAPLATAA